MTTQKERPTAIQTPVEDGAYWVREAYRMLNGWELHDQWELVQIENNQIISGLCWHQISPLDFDEETNVFYAISERIKEPTNG